MTLDNFSHALSSCRPPIRFAIRTAAVFLLISIALAHCILADEATIGLPPTIRLKGFVVNSDGAPVVGEKVYFMPLKRPHDSNIPTAETRADGSFELDRSPVAGLIQFQSRDKTLGGYLLLDRQQREVELRAVALREAEGQLLDSEGKPVAGAKLSYGIAIKNEHSGRDLSVLGGTTTTDADGRFMLERLLPGHTYELKVGTLPQFAGRGNLNITLSPFKVDARPQTELGLVRLPPLTNRGESIPEQQLRRSTLVLRGTVLNPDNTGASGITVEADFLRSPKSDARGTKVKTAHDGSFELNRPPIGALLRARSADRKMGCVAIIDEKVAEATLKLAPLGAARGQLVDSRGKPIAGATVLCSSTRRRISGYHIPSLSASAKTEQDGTYILTGLLPGDAYKVAVAAPNHTLVSLTALKLDRAETIDLGKTPLPPLATIETTNGPLSPPQDELGDAEQAPIVPAVEFRLAETEPGEALTEFVLEGTYQKYHVHDGIVFSSFDVLAAAFYGDSDSGMASIKLRLAAGIAGIGDATAGHVGKPMAIFVRGRLVGVAKVTSEFISETTLNLPETLGDYLTKAIGDDHRRHLAAIRLQQAEKQKADLARRAVAAAIERQNQMRLDPQHLEQGNRLRLNQQKSETEWALDCEVVFEQAQKKTFETTPIDVYGRAVDPGGQPIAGAKIYIASDSPAYRLLAETVTDKDGKYQFVDLPLPLRSPIAQDRNTNGAFVVFGQADGYGFIWRPTKYFYPADQSGTQPAFEEPQRYDYTTPMVLTLNFKPAAKLRGRIVDEDNQPIANTTVEIRYASPLLEEGYNPRRRFENVTRGDEFASLQPRHIVPETMTLRTTDDDGRFEFAKLPPNCRFELDIRPPGCSGRRIWAATQAQIKGDVDDEVYFDGMVVSFARTTQVRVQVLLGESDRPAGKVMVSAGNRVASDWSVTDDDGQAKLNLPAGEYGFRLLPAIGTPYLLTSQRGIKVSKTKADPIVLRVKAAAVVEILVQDADTGAGLEYVDYYVLDPWNEDRRMQHFSRSFDAVTKTSHVEIARTDKAGNLRALFEPGTYQIGVAEQFRDLGYEVVEPELQKVECKAGETVKLKFRLKKTQ